MRNGDLTSIRSEPAQREGSPFYENWLEDPTESITDTFSKDSPTTASSPSTLGSEYTIPTSLTGQPLLKRPQTAQPRFLQEFSSGPSPIVDVDDVQVQQECRGIMLRKGKKFNVSLSLYALTWERRKEKRRSLRRRKPAKRHELSLHDVLGACSQMNFNLRQMFQKGSDLFKLRVYTYKKFASGRWKMCYYQFYCHSLLSSQEWARNINMRLNLLARPRNCQVFVNPFSGEGVACKVYNTKIAHILQIAGITTTVTVTERAGHASEIVSKMDLEKTDAIVCIGGDGLFHEVFNSLLWREQTDKYGAEGAGRHDPTPCNVKIGLIPAGSTNTVVYCTTGFVDPATSALQIAMGREINIDLISVWFNGVIDRFGTNFVGYGFLGDVLKASENYRWMGPSRYDFSGVKTMLNLKSYKGRIEFKEGITSGSPKDKETCRNGCQVCQEVIEQPEREWNVINGKFISIDGCVMSCCSPQANNGLSPSAHLGDGCLDLIIHRQASGMRYFKYLFNTAFFSKPFTGDLVDVHRVTEFRFRGDCNHQQPSTPDSDHLRDCLEDPRDALECEKCSCWNIDGEVFTHHEIHVKVHRKMLSLLACQPDPKAAMELVEALPE